MTDKGLFTDGADELNSRLDARVKSIPLSDVDSDVNGSIGSLVSNATEQMSSLVRAEVELAKAELAESAKAGAFGGAFFAVAGIIAALSPFFFFIFLGELLSVWLPSWASYLIVFFVILALAGIVALLGLKKIKAVKKPEKTIASVQELKTIVPGKGNAQLESANRGMYS